MLVYEREYTMVRSTENTLRITLDADENLTVLRPDFMSRAGHHSRKLPPGTFERLRDLLLEYLEEMTALDAEIRQLSDQELRYVSDPEYSRFQLYDEQGDLVHSVRVTSLEAWAGIYRDHPRLANARGLELAWYRLMEGALGERP